MTQNHDFCPEMLSALHHANSILLCTHITPDGDAIGATLAMGLALRSVGKQVTMANDDPVPGKYAFLPGAQDFVKPEALEGKAFDAALAIDTATVERMGRCSKAYFSAPVQLQLDHHGDNPGYAQYNAVDGGASAAGCMARRLMREMGIPLNADIAVCLYCAISTDTGNFCFQNTTAEAFSILAELMETGFDLPGAARRIQLVREKPHVRLLGRALQSLRFFGNGNCAAMTLNQQDYAEADALPEHSESIVNYAIDLPGVRMAYLAQNQGDGVVKASLRSLPPYNVASIAHEFGGGGHACAAGLRMPGSLPALCAEIEERMLNALEETE